MIPVRLALHNFMCYREETQVLDLTGIHLACLSGENGAGKSALLESITWVLWGKARERTIDDELISKGASEMEVDYSFILGEQHYRVIRKRSLKGKSGTTILDLQTSAVGEEGTWRTLSGATVRETQARINEELKIDYETFINSAFIMQGRADEFTVKSAIDRKKVLADILGLEQYDILEERAKEEARARKSRMSELETRIGQIDRELIKRPDYSRDLGSVEAELREAQGKLLDLRTELAGIRARKGGLEHSQARLREIEERDRKRREASVNAEARRRGNLKRKAEIETLLARREEITQGFADWQAAQAEERRFGENLSILYVLQEEQNKYERQIDRERVSLESQMGAYEKNIRVWSSNLAGRDVMMGQLSETLDKLRKLEMLQEQHEDTKCRRENLDVHMRTLTNEINTLEEEGKDLRRKLDMITRAHSEGHAGCPLCGTGLTSDALERVRVSYDTDITNKRREFNRKRKEREGINEELAELGKRILIEQEQLKAIKPQREREAKFRHKLEGLDDDERKMAQEQSLLDSVRVRLTGGRYAEEAQKGLATVKERALALAYDEPAHRAANRRVEELRRKRYEEDYHKLEGADRELQSAQEYIAHDSRNLEAWAEEEKTDREEMDVLRPQVSELEAVKQELAEKEKGEKQLDREAGDLSERRGGLLNKLNHCDNLQEEKSGHMAEFSLMNEEKGIYDELTVAFGKKGIQAMIIENVLPELEDTANAILERMSDGRMTVQFATQKDAKSGKSVIETLDINISDEMGTRAYEMYSGGEAFRVNFAVRIALSKLLARRAGTQLQTLVIDEGFGSQDDQGREKLVGAIRSIEGDFEKILVITHIEALKDEFPVRINIVKTANGSRIGMPEMMD